MHKVYNAQGKVIACFAHSEDYKAFKLAKQITNLECSAMQAQEAYYAEPITKNMPRATALLHALTEEAIEALREIPTRKQWANKQTIKPINYEAYFEELADIQLFLLAIVLWSGMDLQAFLSIVLNKQQHNKSRQDHAQA